MNTGENKWDKRERIFVFSAGGTVFKNRWRISERA